VPQTTKLLFVYYAILRKIHSSPPLKWVAGKYMCLIGTSLFARVNTGIKISVARLLHREMQIAPLDMAFLPLNVHFDAKQKK